MKTFRGTPITRASFILLLIISVVGCRKDSTNTPTNKKPAFSAFSFQKSNNQLLSTDYTMIIAEQQIMGTIPPIVSKGLVATFTTDAEEVLVNNTRQTSGQSSVDYSEPVTFTLKNKDGSTSEYTVTINWNFPLPHIHITTDNNVPVESKTEYVHASMQIDGNGAFADYSGTTQIRGRGNSTWGMPKKPYRLKLDAKTTLFGLAESKNWVLLANYLDGTLMLNAVAMRTGQLLNMPYTNHIIPVDVSLNGNYIGSYVLTEQVEAASSRVPVQNGGILLELDQNFDEPWEFMSNNYQLPVMVKYPDLVSAEELEPIKTAFHQLEDLVAAASFPNNNYADYIDTGSLANYLLVHMLTDNEEINHPKSTYMYRPVNGKFYMGPIWDFDWAYGFEMNGQYFTAYDMPLFWPNRPEAGTNFFSRFLLDPGMRELFKAKWTAFRQNSLPILLAYVDEYSKQIESSRASDYLLWKTGSGEFRSDVRKLRSWLSNRASYIDSYAASLN